MSVLRLSTRFPRFRQLSLECLETRDLLAVGVVAFPEDILVLQPEATASLPIEVTLGDPPGSEEAARLEVVGASEIPPPLSELQVSHLIDGELLVLGRGPDGRAVLHRGGEGYVVLENLSSLTGDGAGAGFAYALAEVDGEIVIVGQSKASDSPSLLATIWDREGNPRSPEVFTELAIQGSVIHAVTSAGFMTGDLSAVPVVWTPDGAVHELPLQDPSNELGLGASGFAISDDGRFVVGGLDGRAAVWEAVGDPREGVFELKQYAFDEEDPFTLEPGPHGFAPWSAQFVLATDNWGDILLAQYVTHAGLSGGAWSVETGQFLWDAGPGRIMDVHQQGDDIFVAMNDLTGGSSQLWRVGASSPLNLDHLLADVDLLNARFVSRGFFGPREDGFGFVAQAQLEGITGYFTVEMRLVPPDNDPPVFTFLVDQDGNGEVDFAHEGPGETEFELSYAVSGTYNVIVEVLWGDELVARGTTTVIVAPHLPDTTVMYRQVADVNGDGVVNPFDALIVVSYLQSGESGWSLERLDIDGDGRINPFDVLMLVSGIRDVAVNGSAPRISVALAQPSGVVGTGLTNDLSLKGTVNPSANELWISYRGQTRNVSHALAADGVFSLPHDDLTALWEPLAEGDLEFRLWTERGPSHAVAMKLALDAAPPSSFEVRDPLILEDRIRFAWTMARGALFYGVFLRAAGQPEFTRLEANPRTEFLEWDLLPSGEYEVIVLARDAAGNQSESNVLSFSV